MLRGQDEAETYTRRNSVHTDATRPAQQQQARPTGWERKMDPRGFNYWVNHDTRKISYQPPPAAAVKLLPNMGYVYPHGQQQLDAEVDQHTGTQV